MRTRQLSVLTNSADLAAALSDETGTGLAVFNTNPTIDGLTVKTGTDAGLLLRTLASGTIGAIYSSVVTPSSLNYGLALDTSSAYLNGATSVEVRTGNTTRLSVNVTNVNVTPTTASTSTTTGALTVAGGVGIAGELNVGGVISATGGVDTISINATALGNSGRANFTTVAKNAVGTNYSSYIGANVYKTDGSLELQNTIAVNIGTGGTTYAAVTSTGLAVTPTTASTSTTTGALTVAGGAGIAGALHVGTLHVSATIKTGGYTVATLPAGTVGMITYVTDQLTTAAAKGVAPTGGGAVTCPVFYNGTAWVGL